ncbi:MULTISPECIES: nucleotidyltransferase family protein [Ectothiorhodospira]|uniref:nucleotidyltransferase family protein n=1 Tax=Ectothiorhodospira TaxID=1051 RepID=UPI001EE87FFE|nr:nucleotidyltransferase domain-containing protein [Ectothiorhodospira marina]MCG5514959.1 nucleotidyltransferase domain-containing protein [Ectothiorhodospira sp. 9100]MCG5517717.1 nucleotidyltransferase domain-containing protein [Ectothiorhodospira sp. 9905]
MAPEHSRAIQDLARRHGWYLAVLYGSTAREGAGRDIDLAVLPKNVPDFMTQARWFRQLEEILPGPVDLLVVHDGTGPLIRFHIFRDGQCLYEDEPGRFHREQDRAFFLYADSVQFLKHAEEPLKS